MNAPVADEQVPEAQDAPEESGVQEVDSGELAEAFGLELPQQDAPEEETEEAEETEAPKPAAKSSPKDAKPEKDAKDEGDPLAAIRDDKLFDEKALSNKPGIGKARSALLAARKAVRDAEQRNHSTHIALREREGRIKEVSSDLTRRLKTFEAIESRFNADLDVLANGKPNEALEALGRLARRSGSEVYEQLTQAVLGAKKAAKDGPDPRLTSKIEELESKLKKYEEAEGQRSEQESVAQARQQGTQAVSQEYEAAVEDLPNIKYFADAGKAAEIMADLDNINQELWEASGRPQRGIPIRVLLNEVDRRYAKLPREQAAPEKAEAAAKKAAPRLPGRGPSPARAATSSGTRELDEDERLADLANDTAELRRLGFSL